MHMQKEFVLKHAGPAPRYTSYPTAPHFHAGVSMVMSMRAGSGQLKPGQTLSLYIHIPWCDRLCWFCGCNTKQTRKYDPAERPISQLSKTRLRPFPALLIPAAR
jgi:oxygen-independent coproporphyrinogen-3 oxidase